MKILAPTSPGKLAYLFATCFFVAAFTSQAQQSMSIGTSTVKNNAVLYLVSQGKNQGLIIPVVSNKSTVSTPDAGMIVYDESDNKLYYRDNSAWVAVSGASGSITLGGDLSGAPTAAMIAKLQGTLISATSPTDGQILKYNGTTKTWELSSDNGAAYTAGTGIAITGTQIGLSNDGVTTTQIAPNTITNADLNKTTIPISGFSAATASVDLGTQKITNLATPTVATDATTKAYVDAATATKIDATALTTNGDLLFHNGTAPVRLARGTTGQVLQATATSIQWNALTALTNPMTTLGDIIYGGVSGTATRLPGTAGFLKSTGAAIPSFSAVNLNSTDITSTLPILNGGTGATTNTAARTNLGLGSLSTLSAVGTTQITDGTIVNADVSPSAAIDGTKISSDFGSQNILTTGKLGIGVASPTTSLQVVTAGGTTTPVVNLTQTNSVGDASQSFTTPTNSFSVGTTATGSFKISNSTVLGTNDHFEITPGTADASTIPKVLMDLGARGQDGALINSNSAWGTSLAISNGTATTTGNGYAMTVTGPSGPTGQANDFAMMRGIQTVMSIGYNSAGGFYSTNFPSYTLFTTTPMRVGINLSNTTAPGYNLEVLGSAGKSTGTAWINTSDIRLKKDVSRFTDGLNVISKINPIWFRYNGKAGTEIGKDLQVGVVAQEMKEIAPYTVGTFNAKYDETSPEPQEFYNFDYNAIGYAMINAVKELDNRVKELEKENAALKQQLQDSIPPTGINDKSLKAELQTQKTRTDQLENELREIKRLLNMEAKSTTK